MSKNIPPEPPVGTWVKDKHGGTSLRYAEGWGQPGTMPFGRWEAMWEARGPLVECGPWGRELNTKTLTIRVTKEEWDWLQAKLAEEPKALPGIRKLLQEKSPWDEKN